MNRLERKLTVDDWTPESLFGKDNELAPLYGIMLKVPQLASLKELGGEGIEKQRIAEITADWVSGVSIQDIAESYFHNDKSDTKAITDACQAIYRNLVNYGTWGLSALTQLSNIDFESLSEKERRRINVLPAMIYHGVNSEEAVLMRMNAAPRSVAERLGEEFKSSYNTEESGNAAVNEARLFLRKLDSSDWERMCPEKSYLSGSEYKAVWQLLSGEKC